MYSHGKAWVDSASENSIVWFWDLRRKKLAKAEAEAGDAEGSQGEKLQLIIDTNRVLALV